MKTGKYAAVVLAAGFSSRMQSFKPLLEIGGISLVERLITIYDQLSVDVFLVVGWQKERLLKSISKQPINIVENPNYAQGMFSSIQAGIGQVKLNKYEGVFVHPVDIPLVRQYTIQSIINYSSKVPGQIIYPAFNQRRGHPPLIPPEMASPIPEWQGEEGLKGYLRQFQENSVELPVADRFINFDLDTPDDYATARRLFERYTIPAKEECETILKEIYKVPDRVYNHCLAVADLAVALAHCLQIKVPTLDLELIQAAALLHDLAKGTPQHEIVAANIVKEMGFAGIADAIAQHTDLEDQSGTVLESKIVFLADKYISETKIISIEERYQSARQRFGSNPKIDLEISKRGKKAQAVKKELEELSGCPLDKVVFRKT